MPFEIPRTGDIPPSVSPLPPDQKNAAWCHIVQAWLDKHPDQFRALVTNDDVLEVPA